jgi:hypothetical protein
MDDLVASGLFAVVLLYFFIAGVLAGVLYGLYIILTGFFTGNYPMVLQVLTLTGIIGLFYGVAGLLLLRLGII